MEHAHGDHAHDFDWAAMVSFAEADAEVLMPFLDGAISAVTALAAEGGLDVRRIVDVGSGPGVAACALAERFAGATVVAADGSTEMLANVEARAQRLGVAAQVETRVVDLPEGIDGLGPADLVWMSMVLHHVGDEAAALRGLRSKLDAGGLLALVEFGDPLRVVPDDVDLGRPGLWARIDAAYAEWMAGMRASLPGATVSADYPTMLAAAGFEVAIDRIVPVRLEPPLDPQARQVAAGYAERMRRHIETYADPADLAALDILIDGDSPESIVRRPDAFLHVSRHLFVCRAA
jgi:trans-aconitate methyltransferase